MAKISYVRPVSSPLCLANLEYDVVVLWWDWLREEEKEKEEGSLCALRNWRIERKEMGETDGDGK